MQSTMPDSPSAGPSEPAGHLGEEPHWLVGLRGRYQLDDSEMTLREGLAEYYEVNPGLSAFIDCRGSCCSAPLRKTKSARMHLRSW